MGSKSKQKKQKEELPTGLENEDRIEAKIDRDLQDSFPASDPPGWVLGVKRHDAAQDGIDNSHHLLRPMTRDQVEVSNRRVAILCNNIPKQVLQGILIKGRRV